MRYAFSESVAPARTPSANAPVRFTGERAPREATPHASGHGAVEQEPADRAEPADEPDGDDDERAHRARTTLVTRVTAAKPTTMLAAAYPSASPVLPASSMSSSSTCIVEKVVSAPQKPVPSSGRR